jgi:hypothetical protein
MARKLWIEVCLACIVVATAIDIFWSIGLQDSLLENEKNPVAAAIIIAGENVGINGVALLCALKVVTTFIVITVCRMLYKRSKKIGIPVTVGVTLFQLSLVFYLNYPW